MQDKKSLKNRIFEILSDGYPHRSDHITAELFGSSDTIEVGLFRLGARIYDLKKDGHKISGWLDENNRKLYWYRLEHASFEKKLSVSPAPAVQINISQGDVMERFQRAKEFFKGFAPDWQNYGIYQDTAKAFEVANAEATKRNPSTFVINQFIEKARSLYLLKAQIHVPSC